VPSRKRPPLYWKTWLIAGPGIAIGVGVLVADGRVLLAIGLALLALVLFFGPWLLSPYNKAARRIMQPTDEAFERSTRLADWLGSIPVFGVVWRGAQRLTGNMGRTEAEAYRRWLREQDDNGKDA